MRKHALFRSLLVSLTNYVGGRKDLTYQRTDIAKRLRPMIAQWEQEMDTEARVHFPASPATLGARGARGARGAIPGATAADQVD